MSCFLYSMSSHVVDPMFLASKKHVNEYITGLKNKTTGAAPTLKNILSCIGDGSKFMKHEKIPRGPNGSNHKSMSNYCKGLRLSLNRSHSRRKQYIRTTRLPQEAGLPNPQEASCKVREYEKSARIDATWTWIGF